MMGRVGLGRVRRLSDLMGGSGQVTRDSKGAINPVEISEEKSVRVSIFR